MRMSMLPSPPGLPRSSRSAAANPMHITFTLGFDP